MSLTRRRRPTTGRRNTISLDITPATAAGRPVIRSYGDEGFRIAGLDHLGSVLIVGDRVEPWSVTDADDIEPAAFVAAIGGSGQSGLVVIGCGPSFLPPPPVLRQALKDIGCALEWMDTGAACRTFNVLLAEDRAFVAALIAVV